MPEHIDLIRAGLACSLELQTLRNVAPSVHAYVSGLIAEVEQIRADRAGLIEQVERLRDERDAYRADLDEWLAENAVADVVAERDRLRTHSAQMAATLRLEADNIEARARRTPGEPTRSSLLRDAAAFRRLAAGAGS